MHRSPVYDQPLMQLVSNATIALLALLLFACVETGTPPPRVAVDAGGPYRAPLIEPEVTVNARVLRDPGNAIASFHWDFGVNGEGAEGNPVTYRYQVDDDETDDQAGEGRTYVVTVVVRDAGGRFLARAHTTVELFPGSAGSGTADVTLE